MVQDDEAYYNPKIYHKNIIKQVMTYNDDILSPYDIMQDIKYFDETNYVRLNQKWVRRNIGVWSYC